MAEEKRIGDWQHRELRSRARANSLEDASNKADRPTKWYDQPFWIILLLVVFWPVGIVLVWRSKWHLGLKIALSAVLLILIVVSYAMQQATAQL